MLKLIDFGSEHLRKVLPTLLCDRTTAKNIIWATNAYSENEYTEKDQIKLEAFYGENPVNLQPRAKKSQEEQLYRTRSKAEVFTPSWICNQMNNFADSEWFGRDCVFNTQNEDNTWTVNENKVEFPEGKNWQDYVQDRRLEITCGEAPYLVSRYDTVTSDYILPISRRIGLLDRKLRVVNENVTTETEWLDWTIKAYESCYGYEFQGDSLLIARINLYLTFLDYYTERWNAEPDDIALNKIATIISCNIWQMDGFTDTVPFGRLKTKEDDLLSLFDTGDEEPKEDPTRPCIIKNWENNKTLEYKELKGVMGKMGKKKLFDFVIGNPPYQGEITQTGDASFAPPVYNLFMDAAYSVANKVELVTPARFLFNAGYTPKKWNNEMLNDSHFKVLKYEADGSKIFPTNDIKGGIAIHYRDADKFFGPIEIFTSFPSLNSILRNVLRYNKMGSISSIIYNRGLYRFSKKAYEEHKDELSKLSDTRIGGSAFEKIPALFSEEQPIDSHEYVQFLGLVNGKRVFRWFRKDYFNIVENFENYKVLIPKANGSGALGEVLSTPLIGQPLIGHTETFLSFGNFKTLSQAEACLKYVKTKFARVMLGVLKVTQDNTSEKWKYVPLQDFTENSDIDWSKSIHEIDLQLYKKYGLDQHEIDFIEKNVKEMV